jgi:hypothetical protein
MASVSYQLARDGLNEGGSSEVTVGAAAPTTANDIEVRIDLAAGFTKLEICERLDRLCRFILDPSNDASIPL